MHTYPPFGGTEKDYLRAQIARIAGSTMVSPAEYFIPGIEGEDEEEEVDAEDDSMYRYFIYILPYFFRYCITILNIVLNLLFQTSPK